MTCPNLTDTIEACNLNFLIGAGLSSPFLRTLGNIEILLTDLEKLLAAKEEKNLVRISIYRHFFESVIAPNLKVLISDPAALKISQSYQCLLRELNRILLKRKTTILSKEINIFTTNIDVFFEHALETLNLEVNDGFNGKSTPNSASATSKPPVSRKASILIILPNCPSLICSSCTVPSHGNWTPRKKSSSRIIFKASRLQSNRSDQKSTSTLYR